MKILISILIFYVLNYNLPGNYTGPHDYKDTTYPHLDDWKPNNHPINKRRWKELGDTGRITENDWLYRKNNIDYTEPEFKSKFGTIPPDSLLVTFILRKK